MLLAGLLPLAAENLSAGRARLQSESLFAAAGTTPTLGDWARAGVSGRAAPAGHPPPPAEYPLEARSVPRT